MITAARDFLRARDLLRQWTARTLRARYQQSLLGWLWAVAQPAAQTAVFTVIFTRLVHVDTGGTPYAAFAYVATAAWAFLAASLIGMTNALVDNMNLVNKIYFPREVLPLASMLARLMDFGVAAALFIGIAFYFGIPWFPMGLLLLPVILLVHVLLVAGIGLASAALNVFVRDVRSVVLLATQLWLYASPVIYPLEAVPERYRAVYELNPMVGIIEGYRAVLLNGRLPGVSLLISAVIAMAVFLVGYWFFKRMEFQFADLV
jgi:lipopolysaccharide transport system permease protein